jgi:hypothetical protein
VWSRQPWEVTVLGARDIASVAKILHSHINDKKKKKKKTNHNIAQGIFLKNIITLFVFFSGDKPPNPLGVADYGLCLPVKRAFSFLENEYQRANFSLY